MTRFLDNLVLLKEVDSIPELDYTSADLKQMFPEKIVVIRHSSYIYKECLCEKALKHVTVLDDYIHVGELADRMSIKKENIQMRIRCMKLNPQRAIFDFIDICNIHFVKLDREFRFLLENFQPFAVKISELSDPDIKVKLLGDIKIGFY